MKMPFSNVSEDVAIVSNSSVQVLPNKLQMPTSYLDVVLGQKPTEQNLCVRPPASALYRTEPGRRESFNLTLISVNAPQSHVRTREI